MKLKDTFYYDSLMWAIRNICHTIQFPDPDQELQNCYTADDDGNEIECDEIDVNSAFIWSATKEGHEYWEEIHYTLTEYFEQEEYFGKLIKEYERKVGTISPQLELF